MAESIIKGVVIGSTAQAVRLLFDDLKTAWVPRSVIRGGEDVKIKDKNLFLQDWFIEKENL